MGGSENSYFAARGAFVSVYEDVAKAKRNWQIVSGVLLIVLFCETVTLSRLALTARVTPYLVETDRLGRVVALGPVEPLRQANTRLIVSQLTLFIESIRSVVPSGPAEAEAMRRAYAFADQGAATYLNEYFADPRNDPRVLGRAMSRTVDVTAVLPVPKSQTWKVQWTETEYPTASGGEVRASAWESYLVLRFSPPTTTAMIERNPLGIYVSSLSWGRVGERVGE